jgi:nicotinamide-nucleotide amidase
MQYSISCFELILSSTDVKGDLMRIQAEIISTGDEVLNGATVDSNAAHIAEVLNAAGVAVLRHVTVGDNLSMLADTFGEVGKRVDIVIVTGGLGPTIDDLTSEAAAEASGMSLQMDPLSLAKIEAYFRQRNIPMKDSNRKQALFPEGAEPLENPVGTAPGFSMIIGRARFFFMPGVPYEMKKMLNEQVLPRIKTLQGIDAVPDMTRIISTFGLPESDTGQRLKAFGSCFPDLRLGFQVKYPGILLKVYAGNDAPETMKQRIDAAVEWVCEKIGTYVVSRSGKSLSETVGDLLKADNATLAVAESCTGGLISHMLTNVSGSSNYFLFSGVTYANEAKTCILNVPAEIIETYGAVHEETVKAMASGTRAIVGATYGLATSGIAGPTGGTEDKPVGTVCIGLAGPDGVHAQRRLFTFSRRLMNKQMFAAAALDLLRRHLLGGGSWDETI